MIDKLLAQLIEEIHKIRGDLDKMQAYQKTIAEQVTVIAENTTPATEPEPDPEPTPETTT